MMNNLFQELLADTTRILTVNYQYVLYQNEELSKLCFVHNLPVFVKMTNTQHETLLSESFLTLPREPHSHSNLRKLLPSD